jgi:hypothetical protein
VSDIRREPVRIADLAARNNVIADQTFEDQVIVGPAVLVPIGPVNIEECTLPGPVERFIWILPPQRVFGPIGIQNCTFRRCTFLPSVGFAANAAFREKVIGDLLR